MDAFDSDYELTPPAPPRKGDRLIRDDLPDGKSNACVNVMRAGDSIAYIEGYRRGALRLVQHVVEEQRDQDFLVYPIIFLDRHHIELCFP